MTAELEAPSSPAAVTEPQRLAHLRDSIPFLVDIGATLQRCEAGEAELRLALASRHHNSWGAAHGGLTMTLLDSAMGLAARAGRHGAGSREVVTVNMNSQFMRAAQGWVVARARIVHRSLALTFCEAELHDGEGRLCAHATATFKGLTPAPSATIAAAGGPGTEFNQEGHRDLFTHAP